MEERTQNVTARSEAMAAPAPGVPVRLDYRTTTATTPISLPLVYPFLTLFAGFVMAPVVSLFLGLVLAMRFVFDPVGQNRPADARREAAHAIGAGWLFLALFAPVILFLIHRRRWPAGPGLRYFLVGFLIAGCLMSLAEGVCFFQG